MAEGAGQIDKPHLLIVEDDDLLADLLLTYLGQHGFRPTRAATGTEAIERIKKCEPDLVILDLMLPQASGLDVCREVRGTFSGRIIMLTASQSDADHVAGLELGADDFVTKPIEPRVLLARVRNQLRHGAGKRTGGGDESLVLAGPIRLDAKTRDASLNGAPISLTTMEFDVLLMLARHSGTVVEREDLYTSVLGIPYDGIDRGMDVHVSRIRRKLQDLGFDPSRLKSVRGLGYLLAYR